MFKIVLIWGYISYFYFLVYWKKGIKNKWVGVIYF